MPQLIYLYYPKEGTNSALQESIGDTAYLAFMTPQHLHRLGLINDHELFIGAGNSGNEINPFDLELLLRMGLEKIPQLPFEYIMVRIQKFLTINTLFQYYLFRN
jgi:Angiotensin-converting enzyme